MARKSARSITIDPNVRCLRIYPVENTYKNVSELKTIGIKLSREQAIHLARVLLGVSQDWNDIDLTGGNQMKHIISLSLANVLGRI